jgi:Zn-dependent protease
LIAVLFHGLGHLIAAALCGVPLDRLSLSHTGLRLLTRDTVFPSYRAEAVIALGGPVGNLLGNTLLIVLSHLPVPPSADAFFVALNAQVLPLSLHLALWNLLPIEGFDGGRILQCLLNLAQNKNLSPCVAEQLVTASSCFCLLLLWFLSVYLLLHGSGALSLYLFCVELFISLIRKHPSDLTYNKRG